MKLSHLALAAALTLSAAVAHAQTPASAPAAPAARPAPTPAQASGAVARFVVGPGGRVRGFSLADGTLVMMHPRAAEALAARVTPGTAVRVDGFTHPGAGARVIHRATVRGADGTVLAAPPAFAMREPGAWPRRGRGARGGMGHGRGGHARGERFASLSPQRASGAVQQVIAGPRGNVRALLLADGATVYVPRAMHAQLGQRGVRVGERVEVSGRGSATPRGTGLVAERIAFADGARIEAPLPTAR